MAWTEPRIWVDGPHITAAQMNAVSENLRQTAPAKASAAGDIFFATGRNEIDVLHLGTVGQFLVPGVAAPQWDSVPTPITTQGDLVIGNATGEPVRLGASATGVNVLAMEGGSASWENVSIFDNWWERNQWWSIDSADDMSLVNGSVVKQHVLYGRDLSIAGTVTVPSPFVLRFRDITVDSGGATIRCVSDNYDRDLATGAAGGTGTSGRNGASHGYRGGVYGGGGGGGSGLTQSRAGADSSASVRSSTVATLAMLGNLEWSNGRGGDGLAFSINSVNYFGLGGKPGGLALVAAKSVSGGALLIDCSGEMGGFTSAGGLTNARSNAGGGGGGLAVVVVLDGSTSVSVDVSGGAGRALQNEAVGGDGGDGTSYVATSFPS